MSRLLDQLQIKDTGVRKHVSTPLKMVTGTFTSENWYLQEYSTVYRVEVRLGAQVIVSDSQKLASDSDFIIKATVYRPLAEEIFGEFRQPLIDADFAIAQGKYLEASKLIHGILDSMFKV